MMRGKLFFMWLLLATGCATSPPPVNSPPTANLFPTDSFIVQRAVLTIHGRQFTLNGYLALSRTGGWRLIIIANFDTELADVLVKPDGKVYIMRSSQLLRPRWIRRYVVADLRYIFAGQTAANLSGRRLSPTHFIVKHHEYTLDLQIVEAKPGQQPLGLFNPAEKPTP